MKDNDELARALAPARPICPNCELPMALQQIDRRRWKATCAHSGYLFWLTPAGDSGKGQLLPEWGWPARRPLPRAELARRVFVMRQYRLAGPAIRGAGSNRHHISVAAQATRPAETAG